MTVIAAWKDRNVPILIGDFIVSIQGSNKLSNIAIPSRDDLDRLLPKSDKRNIVDLCQKVYCISPTFAVAWAGSKPIARQIIRQLHNQYHDKSPSLVEVRNQFRRLSYSQRKYGYGIILGWIVEGQEMHCFRWNSQSPKEFELGDTFVDGSGYKHLQEVLTVSLIGNDPLEAALGRVAVLLKDEVLYGSQLWHLFGGGFEVAHFGDSGFSIIPSVTFIFLQVEETENEKELGLLAPKRILKYYYDGSIVQAIAVILKEENISQGFLPPKEIAEHDMFYVRPITAGAGDRFSVNSNLSLLSQYYCFCIDIKLLNKPPLQVTQEKMVTISMIHCVNDADKDRFLEIQQEPGEIERMMLKNDLFQEIFSVIQDMDRERLKQDLLKQRLNNGLLIN